eukprot:EC690451.1.p1 GENE.EC690451.1~~EC690451.1.p1  ORF type:complete len:186 (+),score=38.60 EC690451.1:25-558(+)
MTLTNVFITGSSRGIGWCLARQFAQSGSYRVFAGARNIAKDTPIFQAAQEFPDRLIPVQVDVTDDASIERAVAAVQQVTSGLELLINNAGVVENKAFLIRAPKGKDPKRAEIWKELEINALSPVFVTKAFAPLLSASEAPLKRIVNMSSGLASMGPPNTAGAMWGTRMSKAALNAGG